jgi:phosphohistidine phosphatase
VTVESFRTRIERAERDGAASYGGQRVKTLWLLRHAKASPGADGLPDRDRPLNARGREAAARMGHHLAGRGVRPDVVLCSPAVRTRETLELVAQPLGAELDVEFDAELYLASERELEARIEQVSDGAASVMLVGHNPGLGELAAQLAGRGERRAIEALREKFPTGALAEFRIHSQHWRQFARGCELASFVTPKTVRD